MSSASNFAADIEMLIWKLAGLRSSPSPTAGTKTIDPTALFSLRPRSSLRSRMRRNPVVDSSRPPTASATVSPLATTTRMTRTLSRPCSMTSRALVGLKATRGMASASSRAHGRSARATRHAGCTRRRYPRMAVLVSTQFFEFVPAPKIGAPPGARTGAGSRNRTHDQRFTKPLLYQLSYAGAGSDFTRAAAAEVTIGGVLLPCSIRRQQLAALATAFPLAFAFAGLGRGPSGPRITARSAGTFPYLMICRCGGRAFGLPPPFGASAARWSRSSAATDVQLRRRGGGSQRRRRIGRDRERKTVPGLLGEDAGDRVERHRDLLRRRRKIAPKNALRSCRP